MNTEKLTPAQQKALKKIKKVADIQVLKLDNKRMGVSIKTQEALPLIDLIHPVHSILEDMINAYEELGEKATTKDFEEWQRNKKN